MEIKSVCSLYGFACALTACGQIYSWGNNCCCATGLFLEEGIFVSQIKYFTPKKVEFFNDYIVHEISSARQHTIVLAALKTAPEEKKIFTYGSATFGRLGIEKEKINSGWDLIYHVDFFDDKSPYKIHAGVASSYVFCEQKSLSNEARCCETGEPILDILHFAKDKGKFKYWSMKAFEKEEAKIPAILLGTHNAIKQLETKPFPELNAADLLDFTDTICFTCSICKEKTENVKYMSGLEGKEKTELCEKCFKLPADCDLSPNIFYRLTHNLKEGKTLPLIDLNEIYDKMDENGLHIEIAPKYKCDLPAQIIEDNKEKFDTFMDDVKGFVKEQDLEIIDLLNEYIMNKSITLQDLRELLQASIDAVDIPFVILGILQFKCAL